MIDIKNLYEKGMSAERLAEKVLNSLFPDEKPSFPINPFDIINRFGVVYQFMEFEKLEGIYCIPENEDDLPIIGINFGRNIQRQRYTAAHELCHHIKDRNSSICPIYGQKNSVEKYADQFASALLMPRDELKKQAKKYAKNGKVDLLGALHISLYFGTSFEATVYSIAYRLNMYDGDTDSNSIKKAVRNFHPDKKKADLNLDLENVNLWEQIVDTYVYFWSVSNRFAWNVFKNDFIYHENRLERLNLDDDVVAEIVSDLRYNGSQSSYSTNECKEIVEVLGHSAMYDYLYDTDDKLDIYKIQKLHKMLYKYAPYPEAGGVYRQDNNFVTGSEFETLDYSQVVPAIIALDKDVKDITESIIALSDSEVIKLAAKIHHRLTVIHPFADGNGRCSRAILNWIFRLKELPPIYIKFPEKEEYYEGLKNVDVSDDWDKLYKVLMRETIKSSIQLNRISVDSYNDED